MNTLYNKISYFLFNLSIFSLLLGLFFIKKDLSVFLEWNLMNGYNNFTMTLFFDFIGLMFLAVVLFISANVVVYSKSYMSEDKDACRFILLVFAFVISMVLLIVSPNIISVLLGWDGLGLVSYCLVIYYPTKKSNSAGMLTVLSNRVGDVCILLSIALFSMLGDYTFNLWTDWQSYSSLLFYLIVIASMTKSAQIPFSAWLPAAMAAPTPVSALVHSSTLVTAGVYLLIRFSDMLELNNNFFLLFISTMTMFMSGLVANFEYDLKKVIALSTLSQLGMMMFAISLNLYNLAFFHLVIHALFKALLFLCAGAAIHSISGFQDIRLAGSLVTNFPLIGTCLNYANLSLCGFPFLAGFYSKDIILEMATQSMVNQFIIMMMFISVGLTVGYSVRLTYYSFVTNSNSLSLSLLCDMDKLMFIPISTLTIFSVLSGSCLSWLMFNFPYSVILPTYLKMMALLMISLGFILSFSLTFNQFFKKMNNLSYYMLFFVGSMWFFPFISSQPLSKYILNFSKEISKTNEMGWLEEVTINSINISTFSLNKLGEIFQKNEIKIHLFIILIMVVFITLIFY